MGISLKMMKLAKKGFILSLFALIMSSFIIFTFSSRIMSLPEDKGASQENRIRSIDYYLENIFDFAQSAGELSAYYALQSIYSQMSATRQYNPNFESQYAYCATYGNFSPTTPCQNMNSKTFMHFLTNLTASADKEMKLKTTFTINNVRFVQDSDPFYINLEYNLTINISDRLVNISSTRVILSKISIEGFLDPIYLLNGTYNQSIKKHNVTKIAGTWNSNDLQQIYSYATYRHTQNGVSFTNRIKGNFSKDNYGIESIVNHTNPTVIPLINQNSSMIDYIFWNRTSINCNRLEVVTINPIAIPTIPAAPAFQLDDLHRVEFNISSTSVSATC